VEEDQMISWVNRAFTNFIGYLLNEVSGKNPGEILFGPKTDQEIERRALLDTIEPFAGI
jgi:PAS domain-containing protein